MSTEKYHRIIITTSIEIASGAVVFLDPEATPAVRIRKPLL